ncbi:MAG: AAA family ATPase [Nitrospirae bacterium]|nr:AAA family ATPase [Nitrospirota bacterium]MBF0540283.1 AAA family ATPase [Nitrospirota bacterium]
MDYLSFYGFIEDPFKLTPDPKYFYPSDSHDECLLALDYAVKQKEGFALVSGEPGTGKTTILKVFIEKWKDKAEIAIVLTPRLEPDAFLNTLLDDLDISINTSNKNDIIRQFRDFLVKISSVGKTLIIVVDEAQDLPDETLEELRLLSNLETYDQKLLSIILIAQLELEEKLKTRKFKHLKQRITTRHTLTALNERETIEYINFRLLKAGKTYLRFDDSAFKSIYGFSKGIPRVINTLASRSLMSACLEESRQLSEKHVINAAESLGFKMNQPTLLANKLKKAFIPFFLIIAIVLAAILGAVSYKYYIQNPDSKEQTQKNPTIQPTPKEQTKQQKQENIETLNTDNKYTQNPDTTEQSPKSPAIQSNPIEQTKEQNSKEVINTENKYIQVQVVKAVVRKSPYFNAKIIGYINKDERFKILCTAKDKKGVIWYEIDFDVGQMGWVTNIENGN